MSESRDRWKVDDALSLLLRVSRLYGSAPVRFCCAPNGVGGTFVRISRPLHFYGVLLACVINVSLVYCLARSVEGFKYSVHHLYHSVVVMIVRALPLISIAYYSESRMKSFLWSYCNITKIKRSINNVSSANVLLEWTIIMILIVFSTLVLLLLLGLKVWNKYMIIGEIYMIVIHSMWIIIKLQFNVIVLYTNSAFKDINKKLETILQQLKDNSIDDDQLTEVASLIHRLSDAYVSTCAVMKRIIATDSFYLFFHIVYGIITFEKTFFSIVIASQEPDHPQEELAMHVSWLGFQIYVILLILEPCHRAHEELSSTRLLVGQVMCHPNATGKPLFEATNVFYKQLILNDISYSALGIFTIDRSILSVIIGGATTMYLILKNVRSYWDFPS